MWNTITLQSMYMSCLFFFVLLLVVAILLSRLAYKNTFIYLFTCLLSVYCFALYWKIVVCN